MKVQRSRLLMLALACMVVGCSETDKRDGGVGDTSEIEQAAIEAGVIPDIANVSLAGAFERQSDLGTDRFCAVGDDERGYQIGMIAVFGPNSQCEALGRATREGEDVRIELLGDEQCQFTASFDGVELQIPGSLPETCASYCSPRAGFDGVNFLLVGEGDAVARSTQGRNFEDLCPG